MSRLGQVNSTDIRDAIRLGCRTMCRVFNADDHDVPFFGSRVWPEARLCFSPAHSESHVPGRHLNALLNAEDAAGIRVDETAIEKHARAAFLSYSSPVALPLNRDTVDGPVANFTPHNCREGFHALYALAKFRDSARARELAEASVEAVFRYWDPVKGWDRERLEGERGLKVSAGGTFITGLARAIGPLVKYYRATGHGRSLDLALALKEKAADEFFAEDGRYDPDLFGTHTHSTTCVMSSLAQLADLTGDARLMQRVKAFYDHGLWDIRDELGWVIENSAPQANPDRGEGNNTGDIVETALLLGRCGYTECYHDAERILRGHLLPSQLRDNAFIQDPADPKDDGQRNVADRHLGAFGFPAPYGHQPLGIDRISFNMDIVGGAVGSLCEAFRETVRRDQAGLWVNLLFDQETDDVKVESPYTGPALRVTLKRPAPLFVRVPPWLDPTRIEIRGADRAPRSTNGYLFFARPPVGQPLTLGFALPSEEIVLKHRTRQIRTRLRGDQVTAMEHFGADLTYFDPIENGRQRLTRKGRPCA